VNEIMPPAPYRQLDFFMNPRLVLASVLGGVQSVKAILNSIGSKCKPTKLVVLLCEGVQTASYINLKIPRLGKITTPSTRLDFVILTSARLSVSGLNRESHQTDKTTYQSHHHAQRE
jgi:hypothetical protein